MVWLCLSGVEVVKFDRFRFVFPLFFYPLRPFSAMSILLNSLCAFSNSLLWLYFF